MVGSGPSPIIPHGFTHGSDVSAFNWLGESVVNKRQYQTGKVPDLPHRFLLTKLQ